MKYLIIGTAGHVDHGKSALIKALTGVETDRLKEEKLRGISIDLGFASLPLSPEITAGIVDVPGHERFLKNMLAGTGGIDVAMLVAAADEGVMPQTREHLAMLHLYGIRFGIVVVNKIDKVDADWLELVEEDIRTALAHTFLEAAPFCRVSAVTGEGVEELKSALLDLAAKTPGRDRSGPFRLWIDRAFTAHGYGAVSTGSVLSGTARSGDILTLYPSGRAVRVRGLEWHGGKTNAVYAGQRAAINVSGIELQEVSRGMLLSAPERGEVSSLWDLAITWHDKPVPSGTRVRLHSGTGEYLGRLYAFKNQPPSHMRLLLEEPLPGGAGDRGILRLYSPQHLLGGATLIAVGRQSRKLPDERLRLADAIAAGDSRNIIRYVLLDSMEALTRDSLRRKSGYLPDKDIDAALRTLTAGGDVLLHGTLYISREIQDKLTTVLMDILVREHKKHPDRAGISREIVRQALHINEKMFDCMLSAWQDKKLIIAIGGDLALESHAIRHLSRQGDLAEKAAAAFADMGLTPVDAALVSEKLSLPPDMGRKVFDMLIKGGQLIKIGDLFVYRKTIQYIAERIQEHFASNATLTVAELRDRLNTSRRLAVPLMEYFDLHKYTIRDGDIRRPGPKLKDLSEKT